MLKSNIKNSLVINSLIDLGDDIAVEGKGKGRKFVSRFVEPGVAHYEEFGDVLITKETFNKFINTMIGCPVIIKHKDIDDKNADKERVGVVSNVWFDEGDGWFYCDGIIWNKQAIDLVKNQGWNVSCTYDFESDKQKKTHNGKAIDMEFTGGEFLHLALVPNPRYERANIVMNSKQVENDKWITIKPHGEDSEDYRRLKLEDGETPKEAIDRVYRKEDKKLTNKEAHEKLNSLRDEMRKYEVAGTRTSDEYKQLKEEYQKTLDEWDTSQPNKDIKEDKPDTKDGGEDFEKGTKSTKKDEDRHQKVRDLEDKAYKEFKTLQDNYIQGDVKLSDFQKATMDFDKKYKDAFEKLESDRFTSFEDFAKRENKTESRQLSEHEKIFGEGVKHKHSDGGMLASGKGTDTYVKDNKGANVEEFGENGGKYKVDFYDGTRLKNIKYYSTKKGMEKAVKEHLSGGANKEQKALSTKTNLEEAKSKYDDVLKKYNEADRKRWQSGISTQDYYKAWDDYNKYKKELTAARREYAESIMSNFEEQDNSYYENKQADRKMRYEEMAAKTEEESRRMAQISRDMISAIPMGQPILVGHHSEMRDRRYRQRAWDKMDKAYQLSKKSDYYENKADSVGKAGISADDANAIAKLAQKYQSGVDSAEKRRIIDRVIDIHKRSTSSAPASETTEHGFTIERNKDINRLQLKFDGKPDEKTRSILKSNGFRWSPREGAWQRQLNGNSEYSLKQVIEKMKVDNAVYDELENIIDNHTPTDKDIPILKSIKQLLEQ